MGETGWMACNMPQLVEQVSVACIVMVVNGLRLNVVRWHVTCHNLLAFSGQCSDSHGQEFGNMPAGTAKILNKSPIICGCHK